MVSAFRKIELVTGEELDARLLSFLTQRQMPDYFLYLGSTGAKRWLDLARSNEFPIATRLTELLRTNVHSLAHSLPRAIDVVSIGVGDGQKEVLLLKALKERSKVRYFPVDISSHMVNEALEKAADLGVKMTGFVALFEDLPRLQQYWRPPVLLCMLGNNICNYAPEELLSTVFRELEVGDYFLFDCHLFAPQPEEEEQWREVFERAYHSDLNIRFNIGPLMDRGLRMEDCSFKLDLVKVDSLFGQTYRTEKFIEILRETSITIGQSEVRLAAGDIIRMGFTYKYNASQIEGYLQHYNFNMKKRFFSEDGGNLLVLAQKVLMTD